MKKQRWLVVDASGGGAVQVTFPPEWHRAVKTGSGPGAGYRGNHSRMDIRRQVFTPLPRYMTDSILIKF